MKTPIKTSVLKSYLLASIFLTFFSNFTYAGNPQAHWVSDERIHLQLPQGAPQNGVEYWLTSQSFFESQKLQIISAQDQFIKLGLNASLSLNEWIRKPLWIRGLNYGGNEVFRTSIRVTDLLDLRFSNTSMPLGVTWKYNNPSLTLWAPTAVNVDLLLFDTPHSPLAQIHPMNIDHQGFWKAQGTPGWNQKYYLYRVTAFNPKTGLSETHEVADPFSISLSADAQKSQIVNLEDPYLKPEGWDQLRKPQLRSITDAVIYESHIRDLTAADTGLLPEHQGTFLGLSQPQSLAHKHLKELAKAGLTHIHFMPILDFGEIPEIKNRQMVAQINPNIDPDSIEPQKQIGQIRSHDAYNWGYNPMHWATPEGSYSTNPDSPSRILELRQLIKAMNELGLRVVLDVVYNHTYASGNEPNSVFDRIVPYYYHRYDDGGQLMESSCCADVATERVMVEKMILDSLILLAKEYQIDGFRFDLMNLHPLHQVRKIKDTLRALNINDHKVDGSKLLIYGEAWPFGSLEYLKPGSAFFNTRSTAYGIGVFNDRMRDALRGGTTDAREKSDQGFATGLYYDFNHSPSNTNSPVHPNDQKGKLLHLGDVIKVGMAGNLRDFYFRDHRNQNISGGQLHFRNQPVGYASEPYETISYVSAHDGTTLWDAVQAKLPFKTRWRSPETATILDRVQSHKMMLATVLLSQGIAFIEGGSELLRSKSGDLDSYDSGDWFNQMNWSFNSNSWANGLPPAWKNEAEWYFWSDRLKAPELKVTSREILDTKDFFISLLKIRKSHPLLRLPSAEMIKNSVRFIKDELTNGDIPGVIAMLIDDPSDYDPKRRSIMIFINSGKEPVYFESNELKNREFKLTQELRDSLQSRNFDFFNRQGRFEIPNQSVLVFEEFQ